MNDAPAAVNLKCSRSERYLVSQLAVTGIASVRTATAKRHPPSEHGRIVSTHHAGALTRGLWAALAWSGASSVVCRAFFFVATPNDIAWLMFTFGTVSGSALDLMFRT